MPGLAPPPYLQGAPDGQTYFKVLNPYLALAQTYRHAHAARARYLKINHPEARAKARLVGLLIQELAREVRLGEIATAQAADKSIVARIRATQVRPDGKGILARSIESRPIATRPYPTAAVGVADLTRLDNASDDRGRRYWAAQEFGSRHLVGKRIYGYFQPGNSAPSPDQFRVHPVFEARRGGKRMTIQRPISERAFLRQGAADAEQFRYRTMQTIAAKTMTDIERILVAGLTPGTTRRVASKVIRRR